MQTPDAPVQEKLLAAQKNHPVGEISLTCSHCTGKFLFTLHLLNAAAIPPSILNLVPDIHISGGRRAAEAALQRIDPIAYTRSRNFLDGAVTRLSPYLRHGVLTLAEVRDHALTLARTPADVEKFIQELAWRDYWQRLYAVLGDGIWSDREPYKTGHPANSYKSELPAALIEASTGLLCIDTFSTQLYQTGYLHNHARMWLAAYSVHWLRVRWQAGARWFLSHLLDGDPASNNLSWQWIASTFSSKPYFFNRENLERYTHGIYCSTCPLHSSCPLEGSYEALEQQLFRPLIAITATSQPIPCEAPKPSPSPSTLTRPLLWIHPDSLNPHSDLLTGHPQAPALFIWDEAWLRDEHITSKRIAFFEACLAELPPTVKQRHGDPATELLTIATSTGADHILALRTPDPRLLAAAAKLERTLPVLWLDPPPSSTPLSPSTSTASPATGGAPAPPPCTPQGARPPAEAGRLQTARML